MAPEPPPMKLDELTGMAYPQKMVDQIIVGLSDPINEHLVKLAGFDFPPAARQHFQSEVRTWLRKLQRLRIKPNNRTGSFRFYFDRLFDYPFGGVELQNMREIMELVADEYGNVEPTKSPEQLVEWLRQFHTELSERLHNGVAVLDLIPE
jgi:hypothetical protein